MYVVSYNYFCKRSIQLTHYIKTGIIDKLFSVFISTTLLIYKKAKTIKVLAFFIQRHVKT